MLKKEELDKGIYIEDDLTNKEREVQKKIRDLAAEYKKKGKLFNVGYFKLCVKGKQLRWKEKAEELIENRGREN